MVSSKEKIIRLLLLLFGLLVAHLGVSLFLQSSLGSDPFNVFVQGSFRTLSHLTGWTFLTHGRIHIVISLLICVILQIVDKSYIKVGTFVCMLLGGPIIDMYTWLIGDLINAANPYPIRILMLCIGCIILAFGMTIVIKSNAGTGPNDLVSVVLSDKTSLKFSIMRMLVDFCFIVFGFLLGGVFGLGTVICAFLIGPMAGVFMPKSEKFVHWILQL